jgi:hypothetical protein
MEKIKLVNIKDVLKQYPGTLNPATVNWDKADCLGSVTSICPSGKDYPTGDFKTLDQTRVDLFTGMPAEAAADLLWMSRLEDQAEKNGKLIRIEDGMVYVRQPEEPLEEEPDPEKDNVVGSPESDVEETEPDVDLLSH